MEKIKERNTGYTLVRVKIKDVRWFVVTVHIYLTVKR